MANRQEDFSPNVTNVVALNPDVNTLTNVVANLGEAAAQASASTKALQATAQTSMAFRQLDQQFRQKYADDPTSAQGMQELQAARQKVINDIGKGVPTIVMRDFTNKTIELGEQSNTSNELWAGKQQVRNAINNVNTAQNSFYLQANQAGRTFASNGGGDINDALNFIQANQSIKDFAGPVLGEDKTGALLKSFNANYVKSFVAGVAETEPQLAAGLLNDPNIKQHFTTQDIGDMTDVIRRTQKQQQLNQQLQTVANNANLPDIVNDTSMSYFQKRAEIDRLDMAGAISPKNAAAARRVIKSSEDLDSQTDTPVMADIIRRTYDLNENTTLKQSDYLQGVNDLQQEIMQRQDAGQLTPQDATRLNKELTTLTQKRVSDATRAVGNHFGAANKLFDTLPSQYRGDATRQLFLSSQGQNMTPQQLTNTANTIIDGINKQRRTDALGIVARTTNDDVFLQATGYTREQVNQTAQNRGITPDQVIQALRDKYGKKRPTMKPVPHGAGPQDDEGSEGIKLPMANPDPEETDEGDQ